MGRRRKAWTGGAIRRVAKQWMYRTDAKGNTILDVEVVDYGDDRAQPYGTGLALLEDADMQLANGLWLKAEVREGRPVCVAIESREGGPAITARMLRFPLDKEMQTLVRSLTVRISTHNETGETIGEHATGPSGAGEIRSIAERVADVDRAAKTGQRGRPRLSDDFLRQLAVDWDNALRAGESASYTLAELHHVAPSTVRQWMFKARERGLVPER